MLARLRRPAPEAPYPLAAEEWFRDLPPERQAEFERDWRARRERMRQLELTARASTLLEAARFAALFAAGDLLCPYGSVATLLVFALAGFAFGVLGDRVDLGQIRTAALGTALFFGLQWATRGGLCARQMLVCIPVGCACAYLGWRRSERGLG